MNSNAQTYTKGTNYPQAPATVTIGGIDFAIAPFPGGAAAGGTGVVKATEPAETFTFTTNIPGITTVYTLINSGFGTFGVTIGSITFGDLAGDSVTFDLTEGTNVRDHYNGMFNNIATDLYGTAFYPGDVRLDAQQFILPAAFGASTLTSITFAGSPNTGGLGEPFLAAATATTASVPEASTWAMMFRRSRVGETRAPAGDRLLGCLIVSGTNSEKGRPEQAV